MSLSQISTLSRPLTPRAIHIHVRPSPSNLQHLSDILSILRRSGPIEFFKSLSHDPARKSSTLLAVYRDADAVTEVLKASPLRIPIFSPEDDEDDEHARRRVRGRNWKMDYDAVGGSTGSDKTGSMSHHQQRQRRREFQVTINKSDFSHVDAVRLNPFHGPFSIDRKSAVQSHLQQRAPLLGTTVVNPRKEGLPARVLKWQMAREEKSRLPPLRKMYEQAIRSRDAGLREGDT